MNKRKKKKFLKRLNCQHYRGYYRKIDVSKNLNLLQNYLTGIVLDKFSLMDEDKLKKINKLKNEVKEIDNSIDVISMKEMERRIDILIAKATIMFL